MVLHRIPRLAATARSFPGVINRSDLGERAYLLKVLDNLVAELREEHATAATPDGDIPETSIFESIRLCMIRAKGRWRNDPHDRREFVERCKEEGHPPYSDDQYSEHLARTSSQLAFTLEALTLLTYFLDNAMCQIRSASLGEPKSNWYIPDSNSECFGYSSEEKHDSSSHTSKTSASGWIPPRPTNLGKWIHETFVDGEDPNPYVQFAMTKRPLPPTARSSKAPSASRSLSCEGTTTCVSSLPLTIHNNNTVTPGSFTVWCLIGNSCPPQKDRTVVERVPYPDL